MGTGSGRRHPSLEVRGSDYVGKDAVSIYSMVIGPALEKGRTAWIPGHLDMPHTFTYNRDMANALVTLAQEERAWGQAWHVPSPPAITLRELAERDGRRGGYVPGLAPGPLLLGQRDQRIGHVTVVGEGVWHVEVPGNPGRAALLQSRADDHRIDADGVFANVVRAADLEGRMSAA